MPASTPAPRASWLDIPDGPARLVAAFASPGGPTWPVASLRAARELQHVLPGTSASLTVADRKPRWRRLQNGPEARFKRLLARLRAALKQRPKVADCAAFARALPTAPLGEIRLVACAIDAPLAQALADAVLCSASLERVALRELAGIDDEALAGIVRALGSVRSLEIKECAAKVATARALGEILARPTSKLAELAFFEPLALQDEGAALVADGVGSSGTLRSLALGVPSGVMKPATAASLAEAVKRCAALREFRLSHVELPLSLCEALCSGKRLQTLSLRFCALDADAMPLIADLAAGGSLEELNLRGTKRFGPVLPTPVLATHVRRLYLGMCDLTPDAAEGIATALSSADCQLELLDVCNARNAGSEALLALVQAVRDAKRLRTLRLESCGLGPEHAVALGNVLLRNRVLCELSIARNCVGDVPGTIMLAALASNPTLKRLDVSQCGLGQLSSDLLGDLLRQNSALEDLDVGRMRLLSGDLEALAAGVAANRGLWRLSLCACRLAAPAGQQLARALAENKRLRAVDLRHNYALGEPALRALRGAWGQRGGELQL